MLKILRPDCFIAFISSGIKKKLREGDSQRRGKRSEAICAYICIMLKLYRPDCFIALISSGIKRNCVRAIRHDVVNEVNVIAD